MAIDGSSILSATGATTAPDSRSEPKSALSSKSKGILIVSASVAMAAGGVIVILSGLNFFGAVGSTGFIASMAGGGALVCAAIGALIYIAILSCQKGLRASDEQKTTPALSSETNAETAQWWDKLNIDELITKIDKSFEADLKDGYIILHNEAGWWVHSKGKQRASGAELSGVPGKHPQDCNFCAPRVSSVRDFPDKNCRLIASLSNTPLLIPTKDEIPIHWFQANKKTKQDLLEAMQNTLRVMKEKMPDSNFYFEMHCGASGGQTVWHLHLRLHREGGWDKIDWKSFF